ncbi:hypothetical protein SEA_PAULODIABOLI_294 [Microbacterium phage PauloDiaboli]|nr:hypothetical protein SEA_PAULODIABOLI_294 [Microbacterium phage PauloDiaboli]QWY84101.1 hypothetical protein SEA_A3WALLY_294 [Microbacterium phage A3Wally]
MSAVQNEVIRECTRIAFDPDETPERRRKAQKWLDRLIDDPGSNWGNGGKTVAESEGITPDPGAPGGQRVYSHGGQGLGSNEYALAISDAEYNGLPLSTEVDRGWRTGGRK